MSFLFAEQEEPFQAQQSPPSSPTKTQNPYEKSLTRYRSNSSSAGKIPHSPSATSTGLASQPSFGSAGQAVASSPDSKAASAAGLDRIRTNSFGAKDGVPLVPATAVPDSKDLSHTSPPSANPDLVSGSSQFETFDIPERDEDSPAPVPPPAWERRKSMIVRAGEREREQQIQRELQAYQAQQDAEKKAQAAEQAAKSGHGLFKRSKSKSGLDQASPVMAESKRSSKELSPNLKVPVTSSRRRPQSMLQMTSSSSNSNLSGSHLSTISGAQASSSPRPSDLAHSSEDLDSPLPMPNAAFLNGGYSSPGHSRRSSNSSLRGSTSRRSSAYGSPLGLTGDGLNMSLPPMTTIPDMSNPMRSATERPLDTIRQMSMRSERNLDGTYTGSTVPRGDHGSMSNGGRRRSKIGGTTAVGVILDESIWPSAPPTMMEINDLGRPIKSRSTVSLVSLGRSSKTLSRSTPVSPQMARGKQPAAGVVDSSLSPVSTRSTIGRNSVFGSPMAITRDYMIPLTHREGGYAIAATLHGVNGPHSVRGGSGDYGRSSEHNRYSLDSGQDEYGMYTRGMNTSRPSLPGKSTSTSTTSLYQSDYMAPPSSFPHNMPTDPSISHVQGAGLTKAPSPLSIHSRPTSEENPERSNSIDGGLQMRSRSMQTPSAAVSSANAPVSTTAPSNPDPSPGLATPVPPPPTDVVSKAPSEAQQPKKSKKELAKEAKEAKEKRKAEEKQKAIESARQKAEAAREKKKQEEDEKARKEAEKKAAKVKAQEEKAQAKLNKKSAGATTKPKISTLVMPATPLKGRTKDLSAATPKSLPGTPATPAESVKLIDIVPQESVNTPVKPSPLSGHPHIPAAQGSDASNETTPTAWNARTPLRSASNAPEQITPKQFPAIQSVKSKRSLFGTLRRKFGSPSSSASSVRTGSKARDSSTPGSGPSASASLLSAAQPDQSSLYPPRAPITDSSKSSSARTSAFDTSEVVGANSTPLMATPPSIVAAGSLVDPLTAKPNAEPQDREAMVPETQGSNVSTIPQPTENSVGSNAPIQDTKQVMEQMIESAREGGLNVDLHVKYIQELDTKTDELAYHMTEHLRINGVYWGLVALCLMNRPEALDREEMIKYVLSCWDEEAGAFGAHPRHDGHILATLSAVQILAIQDALDLLDRDRIVSFIVSLIDPVTGAVAGDRWGEQDTRFSYIAISILSLIGRLDALDTALNGKARGLIVDHIARCRNFDGGFGAAEGSESHGGQIFVCVAALAILDRLDLVDTATLAWWISERQLPNGGLNGRPEKLEDVCYSWWNLSALSILGKLHWINREELIKFILNSQDPDKGGIADRPGDWVDVFHTNFGLAGLSLLGYSGLQDIDPVYCMPVKVIERLGLKKRYQLLSRNTVNEPEMTGFDGETPTNGKAELIGSSEGGPAPQLAPPLPMIPNLALERSNGHHAAENDIASEQPTVTHSSPSRRLSRVTSDRKGPEGPRPNPSSPRQ
ncbi:hypothetical protein QFC19_007599 [Naganishia cerealis]|uniref:Uncharacterized protein n=1 Tax=Naganishia cerealis TaxID=610337 RepID=A0ACC2V8W7_9TREE|nr:hypothetical protein QFC19_007599 [Naganishia cerealis]